MAEEQHDRHAPTAAKAAHGAKQRRPYVRPELVQYGALQEVTRAYIQTRNCPSGCLVTG